MKFSEFIVREAVIPKLEAEDRDGALKELVGSLAKAGAVSESIVDEIVKSLADREKAGSTGFGKGIAVPHVKHAKIKKMVGTVGRSESGIDFSALDNQRVYTIVLLLSPVNQPSQHLEAMSVIFTNLQDDTFRKFMKQSREQIAILELLDEADQGK
jgi:nitrogen PTS system EIIA component